MTLALAGVVVGATPATAAPNSGIVVTVDAINPNTQPTVGDALTVSGAWDATKANPQPGDTFTIALPPQLGFTQPVPFPLTGAGGVSWGTCLTDPSTGIATCTLSSEVNVKPERVSGTWEFTVQAIKATTEKTIRFVLNGTQTVVEVPGGNGIDDGIHLPDKVTKSGQMNDNNWSMTWKVAIPGTNMKKQKSVTMHDTLGAGHALCDPTGLRVAAVRGSSSVDVTNLVTTAPAAGATDFTVVLTAPAGGFDANVTYEVTYSTCTVDKRIDAAGTTYDNTAQIEGWGENGKGVGKVTNRPWVTTLQKSGSVLGGKDRNGKIAWTVTIPGDQLASKTGFTFTDTLGAGHQLCTDTVSGISVTERYGPSNQLQQDITGKLTPTVLSSSAHGFSIRFDVADPSALSFRPSDYRYVVTYTTCVTDTSLPAAGVKYENSVNVDGVVAGNTATVPGRSEGKGGKINTATTTLDGVAHMPQTTMSWTITVPGEKLDGITSPLVYTDTLSANQTVCEAGSPSGGLMTQLGVTARARDQISGGGLTTVDLTAKTTATVSGNVITFAIDPVALPLPGGGMSAGFSREYQYLLTYTTCTTSGGMDKPKTVYSNSVVANGKKYETTTTQNNSASGTGTGVTRGSVSIRKLLADTDGAKLVPANTMFTVHVEEFAPDDKTNAVTSYDLQVPAGGTAVPGLNARGTGWTAVLTEPRFPTVPGVTFSDPVFTAGPGVTLADQGKTAIVAITPGANADVALTNTARLGSVVVTKKLDGPAASLVDPDKQYTMTATIDVSKVGAGISAPPPQTFTVKAGQTHTITNVPIGAEVTVSEARPADDDTLTWAAPVVSTTPLTVTADAARNPATITVTNTVTRTVGTFSVAKTVTGDQARNPAVPASVEVTASWTEEGSTPQSTVLSLPTDGTAVPFGKSLLIGTKVTLTEKAPADGKSIAWGAPVWTGGGVSPSGRSAIVTVTRDAAAVVSLENHAATSTAGISLIKGLAGEAASEVPRDTTFPVTATWTDAQGAHSKDLTINAVTPTPLGVQLPAGTVVKITEGPAPKLDRVVWGKVTVLDAKDGVEDAGDGSARITVSDQQSATTLVTVVNDARWAPGTFSLSKKLDGILIDASDVPSSFDVTATWGSGADAATRTLRLPADGTAVPLGLDLPNGTVVTLAEVSPAAGAAFTWGLSQWAGDGIRSNPDGTATLTIAAAQRPQLTLTNVAVASMGTLRLTKTLSGSGASSLPADTVFPVALAWTDLQGVAQSTQAQLAAGTTTTIAVPIGTRVTITEGAATLPKNVTWKGAAWMSETSNAAVVANGTSAVVTVTGEPGVVAAVSLENAVTFVPDLAATGGSSAILIAVGTVAAGLIAIGLLLIVRRRRREV